MLLIKYVLRSLFLATLLAVLLTVSTSRNAFIQGQVMSEKRLSTAVVFGLIIFIFLSLLFPYLLLRAKKANPSQEISMRQIDDLQMQFLHDTVDWLKRNTRWLLGGLILIALALALTDSLAH